MATTTSDHPLSIGGTAVETGDWSEVRSPYSGELIGRVARGGAAEARRAVDAAAAAMRKPLPAHERARILDTTARLLAERLDEAARVISAEAGKPLKTARGQAGSAVSTHTLPPVGGPKPAGGKGPP